MVRVGAAEDVEYLVGRWCFLFFLFFFNDTATTEIYTLSLHDALPIWEGRKEGRREGEKEGRRERGRVEGSENGRKRGEGRSEEHTSELQSRPHISYAVFCLKKKKKKEKPVQV